MATGKMDSSAVYALFEELKQKIEQLNKVEGSGIRANSNFNSEQIAVLIDEIRTSINHRKFTPEQIEELMNILAQVAGYSLGKVNNKIGTILTELKTIMAPINEKVRQLQTPTNIIIRKEHVFILDFRRSKTAITIITMALVILVLWSGNIWQFRNNNRLKDNDLKYRYIKMEGNASSQDLIRLEAIFNYNRNKDSISVIREQVESYEQLVKEQAEEIEQTALQKKVK